MKNYPTLFWNYLVTSKQGGIFFQIFVPFSKYLNFKTTSIWFYVTFCVPRNVQVKLISTHSEGGWGLNGRGQGQVGAQEFFRKNYHLLWCFLNICMISSSIELCVFVWKMLDLHIFFHFSYYSSERKNVLFPALIENYCNLVCFDNKNTAKLKVFSPSLEQIL